jgi:hypothetical protein
MGRLIDSLLRRLRGLPGLPVTGAGADSAQLFSETGAGLIAVQRPGARRRVGGLQPVLMGVSRTARPGYLQWA